MSKEIWKDIPKYEGIYQVSTLGNVKRLRTGRILKWCVNKKKDCTVHLFRQGKFQSFLVSRLVCSAFIPNPENKPDVNHKNRNRLDNTSENLEWVTKKENNQHERRTLLLNEIIVFKRSFTRKELTTTTNLGSLIDMLTDHVHKKWAT